MQSQTIFLGILALCVFVVLAVILYGIYQENRYRREVFKQFGNNHQDALLEDPAREVREGEESLWPKDKARAPEDISFLASTTRKIKGEEADKTPLFSAFSEDAGAEDEEKPDRETTPVAPEKGKAAPAPDTPPAHLFKEEGPKPEAGVSARAEEAWAEDTSSPQTQKREENDFAHYRDKFTAGIARFFPKKIKKHHNYIKLDELKELDLPWFDRSFDYMAYITLPEPQELNVLPRFSGKHRFTIAACNLDDQFQLAEPIPGLRYQAYVVGLQAISRAGLADKNDLIQFGQNVADFARSIGGEHHLTDIDEFYEVAGPMDELCDRVDQIIALHLVSRDSVNGLDLRAALERHHFALAYDGAFYYPNDKEELFKAVNIDETQFTASLLASHSFKGFSLLFDITRVPPGAENFDTFMGLAVKLANELGLDLVDDQLNELSTEWLRNIAGYVLARQKEMKEVGIVPGEELAKRLFA